MSALPHIHSLMVVASLTAGLWWAFARRRRPAVLEALSAGALVLAGVTFVLDGVRWQLVPWFVLAAAVVAAAALRRWRPGRSRRWRRVAGRVALTLGILVGGLALLTALVPSLPEPSGSHRVGSVVFRWTDQKRAETLSPARNDRRQVVVQAWYPTDVARGDAVPYFEAQGRLPSSIAGVPSWMYGSFGSVKTHALRSPRVSRERVSWPVLFFSPGLSVPREQYTALVTDLASRGYVVVAVSNPYESAVSLLAGGQVVGQTVHPDVMGPPPHPAIQRLIDIRTADSSFVLDQLGHLAQVAPASPLVGRLDLRHVGFVGHSVGGATAVQVLASDSRFKVGVNLDGKLFGTERTAQLRQPFLWIQSGGGQTAEYVQGRDGFFGGLRGGGALLVVRGSVHMSFTDAPAYATSLGRSLLGGTFGAISAADMTAITGDAISAFVGPALGDRNGRSLDRVLVSHPAVRSELRVAADVAGPSRFPE
jgi:predicted dienelactone hydrolase